MVKVKILGISGSIRHGNTEILVKEALDSAKELPDVETEIVSLADIRIDGPCIATYDCYTEPERAEELLCTDYRDDVNKVLRKMIEADGIIVGSPVYWGSMSAQLKMLIDRTMPLEPLHSLSKKVGAAITVGLDRHGGQDFTVINIHQWMLWQDMFVVGVGPEDPITGGSGKTGVMGCQGWPDPVWSRKPGEKSAVRQDKKAVEAARLLGKKVAESAKIVKAGITQVPRDEIVWPKHFIAEEFKRFIPEK